MAPAIEVSTGTPSIVDRRSAIVISRSSAIWLITCFLLVRGIALRERRAVVMVCPQPLKDTQLLSAFGGGTRSGRNGPNAPDLELNRATAIWQTSDRRPRSELLDSAHA